jgi:hypothetical protein
VTALFSRSFASHLQSLSKLDKPENTKKIKKKRKKKKKKEEKKRKKKKEKERKKRKRKRKEKKLKTEKGKERSHTFQSHYPGMTIDMIDFFLADQIVELQYLRPFSHHFNTNLLLRNEETIFINKFHTCSPSNSK